MSGTDRPVLSVVVPVVCDTLRSRSDVTYLERTLEALARQQEAPPMEVLVPYHAGIRGVESLRERYPQVRFLMCDDLLTYRADIPGRDHHDELRARALLAASGEIVALTEDHGRPDPQWCANIVKAYQDAYWGVGGAIENAVDRLLNWAVYFCDFGMYQNPVSAGPTTMISDVNASYRREALEAIRPVWERSFNQVVVNRAILERGGRLGIFPDIVVRQHREGLTFGEAVAERYIWGRSFAAARCAWIGAGERILRAALAPLLPAVLVARMAANVLRKGRLRKKFAAALPLILILEASWSIGELAGYLSGRAAGLN
jgi:hypothetical protein